MNMIGPQKRINNKNPEIFRGFTLIEALVAVSILMVAVVSPMSIAQRGLSSAIYSKDQMTASFLAQDAIEYVKNYRDNIGLSGGSSNWLSSLEGCLNGCLVDTVNGTIDSTSMSQPLKVELDGEGRLSFYNHGTGDYSKFTRTVYITSIDGGEALDVNEALIRVVVSWGSSPNDGKIVEVKNFIYNFW